MINDDKFQLLVFICSTNVNGFQNETRNSSRDENTRTWRDVRLPVPLGINGYISQVNQVNLIQLKTCKLELDFAEYIQYIYVRIADLCWPLIYHSPGNICDCGLVYINVQSEYELPRSTGFRQIQNFEKKVELGAPPPQPPLKLSARNLSSCSYLPVRQIWPSYSITDFTLTSGPPNWGP